MDTGRNRRTCCSSGVTLPGLRSHTSGSQEPRFRVSGAALPGLGSLLHADRLATVERDSLVLLEEGGEDAVVALCLSFLNW